MKPKEEWDKLRNAPVLQTTQRQVGGDHYKKLKIQPIDYIRANGLGFCEGNALKYITRYKYKGGVEDLRKAIHYLEMLIEDETVEKETPA